MHLIVGLGNPGDKYRNNRHNIGFMAADAIASRHGFPPFREKFKGVIAEGTIGGEKVLILKPLTFMNSSGDSVESVAQFYKLAPADITVIYDEIDLIPGKVRIKTGGGNGGHNGLRSIDPRIGTDYRRVRLGVGHPGHKEAVMHWVLGDFSKADREWLEPLLAALAENADILLKRDDNALMNKLAIAVAGDGAERDQRPETADPTRKKAQSHVRAARPKAPQAKAPETGPMAAMLAKVFGKKDE
ncbi:MAG: aminoacyl-tRNA hydrolase [Devosia nanyangense]|uniref:Peptidyl-tRNA hydrolase n=1 Tax=Devosia nanyangense TaxID=1228055 RepID=A0A933L0K3_9HYPH|nr:aminoacyl-tRNA hydrolase [Devosia nanyangense]